MEPCEIRDNFTEFASPSGSNQNLENNPMHSRDVLANAEPFLTTNPPGAAPPADHVRSQSQPPLPLPRVFPGFGGDRQGPDAGPRGVEDGIADRGCDHRP